ncbi:MAG TPA: tRNA epoxyqueuosine(34) reductase QueG [Bacillota bacterium]|mgnify:CR=1 FL=1|nr:tRNA epoxyqueuosine(34) reductase QueG [Bacillota bacterium]
MLLKIEKLKELAAGAGLELAGVTEARPLEHMLERLQRRRAEGRDTPFEEREPRRRLAPEALLPGCRSIIVLGLPYDFPEPLQKPSAKAAGPRGMVSRLARGLDYHVLLEHKARELLNLIKRELAGSIQSRILVDRSPLLEKELARAAGLGHIGAHCLLITPRYGSFVTLGTILLDRELEQSAPGDAGCRGCGACREACPTGALPEPFILDPARCISYLTQARGIVPVELRSYMGGQLYGCDLCQEACPDNRKALQRGSAEASFPFFPAKPLLLPLLRLTRKEFDQTIGLTAAGWRGKTTLQRNAVIALGNSGDPAAIPALAEILKHDPRPLLRLHAAWSLGRLGGAAARRHLENSRLHETDSTVLREVNTALER